MVSRSDKISTISLNDPDSWNNKVFFTFDVDWAHDEIIYDTLTILNSKNCKSTWFVTHKAEYLSPLSDDNNIEIGVHPNFNNLTSLDSTKDSAEILTSVNSIAPKAISLRSHSLMQSERLIDQFYEAGYSHISNLFIPYSSGLIMTPFNLWNGITVVPHQFQDNVEIKMNLNSLNSADFKLGFHVFNFHPIHIFLNTESLDRYERTRHLHQNPKELIKHRYQGYGTRSRLIELLELCRHS